MSRKLKQIDSDPDSLHQCIQHCIVSRAARSGVNNIDLLADDGMLADRGDFFGFNPGRVYLWALYFAATTFTTVGSAVWGAEHMSCA